MATAFIRDRSSSPPLFARPKGAFVAVLPIILFFMLAFPKGGVRISDVPITFGYLLTPVLLLGALMRGDVRGIPNDRLLAFLPALVMAVWAMVVVAVNGQDSFGYTASFFISALYLPIFGLTVFSDLILRDCSDRVRRTLLWAVRFIVVYGLFLFFYKLATGRWIEIPYLTVNAGDVGNLESKFINRGSIYKLISTYNNGNIFGVAVCIMAPLYLRIERSRIFVILLYAALVLTLSRTVWIGTLLVLALNIFSGKVKPITFLYFAGALLLSAGALAFVLQLMNRDLSFLLDKSLGNRSDQLNAFIDPRIIPTRITTVLPEIVYTGILSNYGYPGLLFFIVHLLAAPMLLLIGGARLLSRSPASACLQGLIIYPVLAGSDSAYNFPPVMMIYWMIAGLGFWCARQEHAPRTPRTALRR